VLHPSFACSEKKETRLLELFRLLRPRLTFEVGVKSVIAQAGRRRKAGDRLANHAISQSIPGLPAWAVAGTQQTVHTDSGTSAGQPAGFSLLTTCRACLSIFIFSPAYLEPCRIQGIGRAWFEGRSRSLRTYQNCVAAAFYRHA
jgi:hypothetical protein